MVASVFAQGVPAFRVPESSLFDSPRNYNASIAEHGGRTWMAYRSHRMDADGRCGLAIAELRDGKAHGNQWLELPRPTGGEHHEDPRLFLFRGELHVAYVESRFYPDKPYTCVLKYARLERTRKGWRVAQLFWPRYGKNDHRACEKNWSFFELGGRLHCIYRGEPHTVLELDGERVLREHTAPAGTVWPWGDIRGGTPPVRLADGQWLTMFHSSTPTGQAPHWRRYYAGAYTFEPEAPFRITAISHRPLLTGSEADGHGNDPRTSGSWKPFVVFPGGLVPLADGRMRVAYGVNDTFIAIAEHAELALGDPAFATWQPRFFRTENASLPVRVLSGQSGQALRSAWLNWTRLRSGSPTAGYPGVMRVANPADAALVAERPGVSEIGEALYRQLTGKAA